MKYEHKTIIAGVCFTVLATLLLAGCGSGSGSSEPVPGTQVDIRGYVTSISEAAGGQTGGVLGSVLIEGELEEDTSFDRASVAVTEDTRIFIAVGGERVTAGFPDLLVGQYVEASFTGPVAESYPVQATASEIVVLKTAP